MIRVMAMTEENETQFEAFLADLSYLENRLLDAQRDVRDNTDVSLLLSLEQHIEDLEIEIQTCRDNARLWGDLQGNDIN